MIGCSLEFWYLTNINIQYLPHQQPLQPPKKNEIDTDLLWISSIFKWLDEFRNVTNLQFKLSLIFTFKIIKKRNLDEIWTWKFIYLKQMWSRECLPFWITGDHPLGFSGVRVALSLVFCVVYVRTLFVLFYWPLYCMSFDLQLLIIPLVS